MTKIAYCIGIMSGTSLDGLDVVYVKLSKERQYYYEIIHSCTYPYSNQWISLLKGAFEKAPETLKALDVSYGGYIGSLVNDFVKRYSIKQVDFVASHGHTIFHKPYENYTLQIGCGREIRRVTGCKVVFDFRTQDVALGGQGAPLVPIGDALLFPSFQYCLNLGGFANISFDTLGERKAYDICPVNIVLNHYMNHLGKPFDNKGELARMGSVDKRLLADLNNDPFYVLQTPKSLGFEFVKERVIPLMDSYHLEIKDLLRTFLEHVAIQIALVINPKGECRTLVTGGGAYNDFLLERIKKLTTSKFIIPNVQLLEFKEALIFALLGFLRINGEINCLKSVTGASKDHSSGKIVF